MKKGKHLRTGSARYEITEKHTFLTLIDYIAGTPSNEIILET